MTSGQLSDTADLKLRDDIQGRVRDTNEAIKRTRDELSALDKLPVPAGYES